MAKLSVDTRTKWLKPDEKIFENDGFFIVFIKKESLRIKKLPIIGLANIFSRPGEKFINLTLNKQESVLIELDDIYGWIPMPEDF